MWVGGIYQARDREWARTFRRFRRGAAATGGARGSEGKARGLEGLTHGERWRRRAGGGMVGAPRASAPRDRPRPLCPGCLSLHNRWEKNGQSSPVRIRLG